MYNFVTVLCLGMFFKERIFFVTKPLRTQRATKIFLCGPLDPLRFLCVPCAFAVKINDSTLNIELLTLNYLISN